MASKSGLIQSCYKNKDQKSHPKKFIKCKVNKKVEFRRVQKIQNRHYNYIMHGRLDGELFFIFLCPKPVEISKNVLTSFEHL